MTKKYVANTNNTVTITGTLINVEYSYTSYDEKFYSANVEVKRAGSENVDTIPVSISEKIVKIEDLVPGIKVTVTGQFRSFNKIDEETQRRHLILSVFCKDIVIESDDAVDSNEITLCGYICKLPNFRRTPMGREITDLLVAVNRSYGKTDYIPCIAWGRNAKFTYSMELGTKIDLVGRIQSRIYSKKVDEDTYESKTVYEVSLRSVAVVIDPEDFSETEENDNVEE